MKKKKQADTVTQYHPGDDSGHLKTNKGLQYDWCLSISPKTGFTVVSLTSRFTYGQLVNLERA